jgi:hypothetical protein
MPCLEECQLPEIRWFRRSRGEFFAGCPRRPRPLTRWTSPFSGARQSCLSNRDFNLRPFQSIVVLRWEWRPGSTLYLVWQQSRGGSEPRIAPVGFGDLFGSLSSPGDNILAVKTTVWISR